MQKVLGKYLLRSVAHSPEGDTPSSAGASATPSPEAISSPSPETPNPAPAVEPSAPAGNGEAAKTVSDSGQAAEGAEGSGKTGPSETPLTPKPKGKVKDWRDDRIAKLTAQLREKTNAQAVEPVAPAGNAPLDPTADFNARVAQAAQIQVALNTFNDRCNAEAAKGRGQWEDFDARLADVRSLVNVSDPDEVAAYNALLQAGLETGELATLMYELGQDLDEANRILALSPLKMGVELTKKALKGAQIEGVSKVPTPVRPLAGGRGEQLPVDPTNPDQADNLTTAEWMKRREAQVAARGRS